jgi:predicted dehydrogenase
VIGVSALTHFACWSHCIDLILNFAGPLHEISAQQGNQPHPFEGGEATDIAASFIFSNQAAGVLLGTSGMHWDFPLFELTINFEGGRIHFRDLDQEMEVLDYRGNVHELFSPVRHESRWNKYNESFEKSVDAYLASVRDGAPPPVPGIAGLLELQFEASIKKSIAERRPVNPSEEFPTDPL